MIGYGMLYAVAVGVPILLTAWVVSAVLRRHGRPERAIWLSGLVLAFVLPVVGLLRPGWGAVSATGSFAIPEPTGVIGLPSVVAVPPAPADLGFGELVLVGWLLTSALLALRWILAARRLGRAGSSWRQATLDGVPVWMTDTLGPAVAGVLRPRVLVPEWLESMPSDRRSLVLLHEQEHIRAGDPWLMVASRLAPILAPWNPIIWILSARLLRAIELDCDRRVLRRRPDIRAYGTTLIEVSSRDSGRLVAVAAFAESEAPLRNRILNMTMPSRTVSVVALMTSMVFGVVLMIAAFEIPIPTLRAEFELGPGAPDVIGPEPSSTALAAPDEPNDAAAADALEPPGAIELPPLPQPRVEAPLPIIEEVLEPPRSDIRTDISANPTFTAFTVTPRLTNLPEIQRALAREYPTVLRDAGIGGTVYVWFFIDEQGLVRQTRIDRSSGHAALDQAAMNVAGVYRFSPALNRDTPVPVWLNIPITFQVR